MLGTFVVTKKIRLYIFTWFFDNVCYYKYSHILHNELYLLSFVFEIKMVSLLKHSFDIVLYIHRYQCPILQFPVLTRISNKANSQIRVWFLTVCVLSWHCDTFNGISAVNFQYCSKSDKTKSISKGFRKRKMLNRHFIRHQ